MTASSGNPWADVARSSMILSIGAKSAGRQLRPIFRTLFDLFHGAYLRQYMQDRPDGQGELERWLPVIAGARLDEHIQPETTALIELAGRALHQ